MTDEEMLRQRYPNTQFPERPPIVQKPDPLHVQRYGDSMFTQAEREEAARELAPEIQPPPGVDPQSPAFVKFKRDVQAAGIEPAAAARLLNEIMKGGGG